MRLPGLSHRKLIAIIFVIMLSAFAWCGVRLALAKQHLEAGRDQLLLAKQALVDNRSDLAAQRLAQAGSETARARGLTHDPVSWALGSVPVAGWPIAVGRGLTDAADRIARDVLPPALKTSRAINGSELRRPDGSIDLAAVRAFSPALQRAATDSTAVRRSVQDLPDGLVPALSRAQREFRAQVDDLTSTITSAADAVRLAPAFLGGETTKRWFVLVMQTAESRGSGGIPGGYAVLRAQQGRLVVEASGSNRDLKDDVPYAIPADIPNDYRDRYELDGGFSTWPNVTLSPDFPVVAEVIAGKWRAQGGGRVDGVISVDSVALSKLLQRSSPIVVGTRSVSAEQLVDYLAVGQYADNPTPGARKDRLAEVAAEVLGRITSGRGSAKDLVVGVSSALRSGHVHFATKQAPFREVLARTGLDGALPAGPAPVAYAAINNATGGKLDHFLERRVEYVGGDCRGQRRDVTIAVTLTSKAPPVGALPSYVTLRSDGDGSVHSSTGKVLLDVFGTRGAVLVSATLNGKAVASADGLTEVQLLKDREAGLPVWRVPIETPSGKPQVLKLRISEPRVAGRVRIPEQAQDVPLNSRATSKAC